MNIKYSIWGQKSLPKPSLYSAGFNIVHPSGLISYRYRITSTGFPFGRKVANTFYFIGTLPDRPDNRASAGYLVRLLAHGCIRTVLPLFSFRLIALGSATSATEQRKRKITELDGRLHNMRNTFDEKKNC